MKIFSLLFLILSTSVMAAEHLPPEVQRVQFWGDYQHKDIFSKIQKASPKILEFITQDNIKLGWPNKPTCPESANQFGKDIYDALKGIPYSIRDKLNQKLVGIFIVKNLGGSALTNYVYDGKGAPIAGFIVLDIDALDKKANDWATWKENTPFAKNSQITITAKIEEPNENNRKNTFQYILLHEFGHLFSIGRPEITRWDGDESAYFSRLAFTKLSWRNNQTTLFEGKKLNRTGLRYYGPKNTRLPATHIPKIYSELGNTNFPTLYAATNPTDDFAESFASFIHTDLLDKPWLITITEKNKKPIEFKTCWKEDRCEDKKGLLQKMLSE